MLVYATTADLSGAPWSLSPLPEHADLLLSQASRLVRRATMTTWYPTDATGFPRDAHLREALRDATCAQVLAWARAEVDPATGGYQPSGAVVQSKGIGSARVSYDTSSAASVTSLTARASAATALSQDAYLILSDAGLWSVRPGTFR